MTRRVLVVADDLTGAMDTGHEFAARGCRTTVQVGGDDGDGPAEASADQSDDDASVTVVDTDSRYADADAARESVATVVRETVAADPDAVVYKKVDSTLRGNVAAEVTAARAAADRPLALVAPAFPANGRLTAEGHHLVDGVPVTATAAGDDAKAPATSYLPRLLGESEGGRERASVPRIASATVARGPDAVAERLGALAALDAGRSSGSSRPAAGTLVACDAVHDDHLAALADGADPGSVVFAGSGGLARHVPLPDDGSRPPTLDPATAADRRALAVVGSVAAATLDQVARVPDDAVVRLDAAAAVREPEAAATDAAVACLDRLEATGQALVTAATDRDDVTAAREAGRAAGVPPDGVGERVATALAATAAAVWRDADPPPTDSLLTGGAVARATLDALDAAAVAPVGRELGAGIPVGLVRGGVADGTPLVTKAGAFGGDGVIANYLGGEVTDDA
ncbi:four-carbon acid sugar kinase family protein [Halobium salinum]|uniref:Four-carbon acid sugar kinase family protein n=1 Tax=Halobium salinum TaxID=1364940 RepID=A0ABD5PHH7_9EURY|nr:four-carbon acid sugar kinase family protein [Halobium salinum]